jgi:hypothetical protein
MNTFLIWAGVWLILGLVFVFLWAGFRALERARDSINNRDKR